MKHKFSIGKVSNMFKVSIHLDISVTLVFIIKIVRVLTRGDKTCGRNKLCI